jgi:hypothetical protein
MRPIDRVKDLGPSKRNRKQVLNGKRCAMARQFGKL